jgi:3-oxoacyl-[acyl-carrier protein] reductase
MYRDRIVLITGASRGIGKDLCEHFLRNSARVIGISRSACDAFHENYRHFPVDVSDENAVQELFRTIRDDYGAVDILINNAGVLTSQYALLMPASSAETMIRTNFLGAFLMARESAKLMMQKKFGRIINISSMAVTLSPVGDAVYSASKSALTQFSRVFAKEVGGYGITCNVLGITAIETEMLRKIPREAIDKIIHGLPIKRLATIGDITNALDFFVRKESDSITGQVLYLGGAF